MATLNGAVYAFGGQACLAAFRCRSKKIERPTDTVEVWDMDTETWGVLDVKMTRGRSYMAAVVVDPKKLFRASWSGSGSESGDGYGIGFGSGTGTDYGSESG